MYIIFEAYDDNTADVVDMTDYRKFHLGTQELIKLSRTEDVLGLSVSGNKINYINSYNYLFFCSDEERKEYAKESGVSLQNTAFINDNYVLFMRKNKVIHVDYVVCTKRGPEITYVCEYGGYTIYPQSAKVFTKNEAYKKAAMMTKVSKTGTHWYADCIIQNKG